MKSSAGSVSDVLKEEQRKFHPVPENAETSGKGSYSHYVLKEIHEQADSFMNTMRGRVDFTKNTVKLGGIENYVEEIRSARRVIFIAAASSYHAALAARPLFEELTGLPITLEFSSDFCDRKPFVGRNDTCVFISQSGETGDTIKALEYCKSSNALCVGVTNTVGSTLSKLTHCGIYLNAGKEYASTSTKGYTSQILALTLMALKLGELTVSTQERRHQIIKGMKDLPQFAQQVLKCEEEVKKIAAKVHKNPSILVMGRGYQFATCLEGALKLKEIASIHSEGVLSGELKHGPLALVDEFVPIVFVATKDKIYEQATNAFSQVTARKGKPIIIRSEDDSRIPTIYDSVAVPTAVDCLQSVLNIIPIQLLSYHIALLNGLDPDITRVAKVITV